MSFFLRLALRVLLRVRVLGDLAAFDQTNRVVVISNHVSALDALLLALFLPRKPAVVVPPEEMKNRLLRRLVSLTAPLVLDVSNPLTIKRVLRLLREGRPVVLFPEGRINTGNGVAKVYPVAALIALKSGAMVMPVHVEGASQWFSRSGSRSFLSRILPSITLRVLPPTRIDGGPAASGRRRRIFATRTMASILQKMAVQSHASKPIFERPPRWGRSSWLLPPAAPGPW